MKRVDQQPFLSRRAIGVILALVGLLALLAARRSSAPVGGESERGMSAPVSTRRSVTLPPQSPALPQVSAGSEARGLSGHVTSFAGERAGEPLSGASVCLVSSIAGEDAACVVTNPEGHFVLENALCGAGARLLASAPGHTSKTRVLERQSDCAAQEVILALERGGVAITGTVVDATGGFISGARVLAREPTSSDDSASIALTAEDGSFRLSVPKGAVELVASAKSYSRSTRNLMAPQRDVVLTLVPASTIVGEVVLESGESVSGAQVMANNKNGTRAATRSVETDSTGHFILGELAAGGYEVSATTERLRAPPEWMNVGIGERASIKLVATSASALHASVDVSGVACVAGNVTLDGPAPSAQHIDSTGSVRFEGLARGRYQVSVRCTQVAEPPSANRRKSLAELAEVAIVDRDVVTAQWSLTEPEHDDQDHEEDEASRADTPAQIGSISGQVLDEQGNPVPEAWVTASSAKANSGVPSLTDSAGAFALNGLAEGSYELSASSSLGEGRLAKVPLNSANVRLRVGVYGAIFGSVQATDGTPADVFTLIYRHKNQADIRSLNGSQGKWSLPWLPAGTYRLSATGASGCGWTDAVLSAGGNLHVSISLNQSGDLCSTLWRVDPAEVPATTDVVD
jgi:hypothetical protein